MSKQYTEQEESEIVELFMLNEDDRDERLKAHYRQGKIVFGKWVNAVEEKEEDSDSEFENVCCVGCGEVVCNFNEEPPHKDDRDEAVCEECYEDLN